MRLHALRVLETGEPLLLRLLPGSGEAVVDPADAPEGTVVERTPCPSGGSLEIFLEPQLPAPRLLIIGGAAMRTALEVPDELPAQLHTPAGRDIGARTPHEIAISILAELIAEQSVDRATRASIPPPASATDPSCGMEVLATAATP